MLPLAAEDLNVEQMADAFESVRGGQRPDTTPVPTQALEGVPEDMQRMFKVSVVSLAADVSKLDQLKAEHPHSMHRCK